MQRSWKFIALVCASYILFAAPVAALPEVKPTFPRLANYFLHWTISEEEARELAKWDLLILDMETQYRSRESLELIRRLNPSIILLAYLTPVEIRSDVSELKEAAPLRHRLLERYLKGEWYLFDTASARRSFWPGTYILNITPSAPAVEGRRWHDVLPLFVKDEIISSGLWDGVFYDNGWGDPSHHTGIGVDLNQDGNAESVEEVNRLWKEGMKTLFKNTQSALGGRSLVMVNGNSPDYAADVHGVLFEYFPREGWPLSMGRYSQAIKDNLTPSVTSINRISENARQDDYRGLRFGLASTLLSDGYYSFDYGVLDHGQIWQYDEYGAFLGEPIEGARSYDKKRPFAEGLWRRDFEQGIVLLNSGKASRTVSFPAEVEKIRGTQDQQVNDGTLSRSITVAGDDGVIVRRPLRVITGAPFENGVFARVFNAQGEATRVGFFAFDKKERSGTMSAVIDMDGDKKAEKIRVVRLQKRAGLETLIEVGFGDGKISRFSPFGSAWQGEVHFDIGDLNRDGILELIVAQGLGGNQVKVFRPDGTLISLPFFPFGPRYQGGMNVAVGDLNADGFSEIVIGAGPGGGPQVRIFNGEGKLLSGGFFAYDPRFRGGVRVAVGDTNGDNKAEIVTGPGPGGGPQIRIFNGKGVPLSAGFFAFDRSSRVGAIPLITDVDGDGKNEILAVTKEVL